MRALLSVYDKEGLLELAEFFKSQNIEMVSTGGTYRYLSEKGFNPLQVEEITNSKEILDGRVKTLHPIIHGGILYRRDMADDRKTVEELGIEGIDMVCVNLYPFFEKLKENLSEEEQVEFIDIGGPTMLRAAAKNFKFVYSLSDPKDYKDFMKIYAENDEKAKFDFRKKLAGKVFNLMGAYDSAVANYLLDEEDKEYLSLSYKKVSNLRYGENPHQKGYTAEWGILLDLVGAKGATFHKEEISRYFAGKYVDKVWDLAHKMGYEKYFIKQNVGQIHDDHYYVNTIAKIPMIDIIYTTPAGMFGKYHHTHNDDIGIIDKEVLKAVTQVTTATIYKYSDGSL